MNATYLNEERLECVSPANTAGPHSLEVSVDAFNFTADGVAFSYYPEPEVQSLAPTGAQRCPVARLW